MCKSRIIQVRIDAEYADTVNWLKSQPGGISWFVNHQIKRLDEWRKSHQHGDKCEFGMPFANC